MPFPRVMEIVSLDHNSAKASVEGMTQDICLEVIDERPAVGDRVIVHAGFAIHCMKEDSGNGPIDFIREMMEDGFPD